MKIYTHIKDLPFAIFQSCLVDEQLSLLVIDGEYTNEQLQETWTDIFLQYQGTIKTNKSEASLSCVKNIAILQVHLALLEQLLSIAEMIPDELIFQRIRAMGYNFPFTEESYKTDLEKVRSKSKSKEVRLNQLMHQQESMFPDDDKASKPTYEYFAQLLNAISKMEQMPVPETISTLRFCIYLNKLFTKLEK